MATGEAGGGKSHANDYAGQCAVPNTKIQLDHKSALAGTGGDDQRGFIHIYDEVQASQLGISVMTSTMLSLIQFCLGELMTSCVSDTTRSKTEKTNTTSTAQHLHLNADGLRVLIQTMSVKYGVTLSAMNMIDDEIDRAVKDRLVTVACNTRKRTDRDITDAMRALSKDNDPLKNPATRKKLVEKHIEYNRLVHFKASMIYVMIHMGLLPPINSVFHDIFHSRLTNVLAEVFGITARHSRKSLIHRIFSEAGTIQRAVYLVDTLGIGGMDLSSPFQMRHVLRYAPFLCIPSAVSIFEAEFLNLFVDRALEDVCLALQAFLDKRASVDSNDGLFQCFTVCPLSITNKYEQIAYLAAMLKPYLQNSGILWSLRKIAATVATMYTLCVTVPKGRPKGGTIIEGLKFATQDQEAGPAPVFQRRGGNSDEKKEERRRPPVVLMVNKVLLDPNRTADVLWRAVMRCFPADADRCSYVRGKLQRFGKFQKSHFDPEIAQEMEAEHQAHNSFYSDLGETAARTANASTYQPLCDTRMQELLSQLDEKDEDDKLWQGQQQDTETELQKGHRVRNPAYVPNQALDLLYRSNPDLIDIDTYMEAHDTDTPLVDEIKQNSELELHKHYLRQLDVPEDQIEKHYALAPNLQVICEAIRYTEELAKPVNTLFRQWLREKEAWEWISPSMKHSHIQPLVDFVAHHTSLMFAHLEHHSIEECPRLADFEVWMQRYGFPTKTFAQVCHAHCLALMHDLRETPVSFAAFKRLRAVQDRCLKNEQADQPTHETGPVEKRKLICHEDVHDFAELMTAEAIGEWMDSLLKEEWTNVVVPEAPDPAPRHPLKKARPALARQISPTSSTNPEIKDGFPVDVVPPPPDSPAPKKKKQSQRKKTKKRSQFVEMEAEVDSDDSGDEIVDETVTAADQAFVAPEDESLGGDSPGPRPFSPTSSASEVSRPSPISRALSSTSTRDAFEALHTVTLEDSSASQPGKRKKVITTEEEEGVDADAAAEAEAYIESAVGMMNLSVSQEAAQKGHSNFGFLNQILRK